MLSSDKHQLLSHFRCPICLNVAKEPVLCSTCSDVFCKRCIERCLATNRNTCPVCRRRVRGPQEFLACRWASQLSEKIEGLSTREMCESHPGEALSLFCTECSQTVCSNCILTEGSHYSHDVSSLQSVIETGAKEVTIERERLSKVNDRLLGNMDIVRRSAKHLKTSATSLIDQGNSQYRESVVLLVQGRQQELLEMLKELHVHAERVQDLLSPVSPTNQRNSTDIIQRNTRFVAECRQLAAVYTEETTAELQSRVNKLLENAEIDLLSCLETAPPFTIVKQIIHDFTYNTQEQKLFTSERVSFCDMRFCLRVQCGNTLGVFVEEMNCLPFTGAREFQVEVTLVNQFGSTARNKRATFILRMTSDRPVSRHVEDLAMTLRQLQDFGFLKDKVDTLVLRFSIRPLTYQVLSRIQQDYITRLEKQST